MLFYRFSQLGLVPALNLVDFYALLVELEGGHGLDPLSLGCLVVGIHVHLVEENVRKLVGQGRVLGLDRLAGPAPAGSEIDDHQLPVGELGQSLVEILLGFEFSHWHGERLD